MNRRQFLKVTGLSATTLVVGGVAFRVGNFWWDQTKHADLLALSQVEADIVDAISDAMFPGDGFMPNGKALGLVKHFDRYVAGIDDQTGKLLRLLLHAIDDVGIFADGNLTRFRFRNQADRVAILDAWDRSTIAYRRGAFRGIKITLATAYCEHPDFIAAAGIDYDCGGMT